jgi:DNA replication protein DnaC
MLQKIFKKTQAGSEPYRAVDPATVTLTDDEKKIALNQALNKKIAEINNAAYLKAVSTPPVYIVPLYEELYEALITELTNVYGWVIDQYNHDVIEMIARYHAGDPEFENMGNGFSLAKGNLYYGPIGCGKTTLLKVLQKNSFNPYRVVSCRDIAQEYAVDGPVAISKYSSTQYVQASEWFNHPEVGLGIDDLGTEDIKKNYGNELNVMSEIILNRYDHIIAKNKTHVTTNLNADQIKSFYGAREVSRMRQMFNFIEFPPNAPDRRK